MALRVESEDTPLQQRLTSLADSIGSYFYVFSCSLPKNRSLGYFGLAVALATVTLLTIRETRAVLLDETRSFDMGFMSSLVHFIITGITILVVAIPEARLGVKSF